LVGSLEAQAQQVAQAQMAQATTMEVPEQVLITGSLIRGTAAVGVPVTNLSPQDFTQTGAVTTAELFRSIPSANVNLGVQGSDSGARIERGAKVNIRGFDSGTATRSLLMIDGLRFPGQGSTGVCAIDPSIIPALAMERLDVLVDGASATYGSDAVAGVMNILLKRAYDGAVTQLRYTGGRDRAQRFMASQLWGRTWDGGDVTLTYEWYDDAPVEGSLKGSKWRTDFTPWGLENRIPIASSLPGTISTGAPSATLGSGCTNCYAIPKVLAARSIRSMAG
jgi:iron complex outermembrane receptor protein